jgi:hypothetical protein
MPACVLSAALSAIISPGEMTADVTGVEAFPVEVQGRCGWGDTI